MIYVAADDEQVALVGTRLVGTLLRGHDESGRRPITLVLSGGRTPRRMYEALAGEDGDGLVWDHVAMLWGDERCVAPDDDRSNYRLADSSGILRRAGAGVYRMPGELPAEHGALAYEARLRKLFPGSSLPRLDIVLLGLGDDGHTASLFPRSAALKERDRLVVATEAQAGVRRLTLTLPVLANARDLVFLVTGKAKAEAVRLTLGETGAARVKPPARLLLEMIEAKKRIGQGFPAVAWVLDEAAASGLSRGGAPS